MPPSSFRLSTQISVKTRIRTALPGVFPQIIGVVFRSVHVPPRVGRHAFSGRRGFVLRSGNGNEHLDAAVSGAADPNALLKPGVHLLVRLRVGYIDRVACVNENAARAAELLPLVQEFPVLVEDLNATVTAVADE